MAYDEGLAERVRKALARRRGVSERKMFGGLAFLRAGSMLCGVLGDELMVRVGPERHDQALRRSGARPMDFTGRPMKGYVFVGPAGYRSPTALARWVEAALQFVATLPSKPGAPRKR